MWTIAARFPRSICVRRGAVGLAALLAACTGGVAFPSRPYPDRGAGAAGENASTLRINELMPRNDSTVLDEYGEADDWVELLNVGSEPLDLLGWGLGEDGLVIKWTFPASRVLAPGERVVVWLDDDEEQGELHSSFGVDVDNGSLYLHAPAAEGGAAVEKYTWEDLGGDVVLGRFPDGGDTVSSTIDATPGSANPSEPDPSTDPSETLFLDDEILTFELSLAQTSRDQLGADPYTWVEGALTWGEFHFEPVGVRIKGMWGSYRTLSQKAALKVKLDQYEDFRLRGLENLTFNNMVQDPSCVHEKLAYILFQDAGVPSPRTGYAMIYLDGEYRGLYANIETVDEQLLSHWYTDDEGNLYEGSYGADIGAGGYTALELDQDGDTDVDPYADLAVLAALIDQTPSEDLVDDLAALVDIDEVLAMLAGEVMLAHWDGYFWYPNNYRFYHDPSTGLFSLLPWGTDQTFGSAGDIWSPAGDLAWWMLQVPSLRDRYERALIDMGARMRGLGLAREAQESWDLIYDAFNADPYKEVDMHTSAAYLASTLSFLETWPESVLAQVSARRAGGAALDAAPTRGPDEVLLTGFEPVSPP